MAAKHRANDPEREETGHSTRQPRKLRAANALLFEVAWEVCRQVGGIYTVLRSKAPSMDDRWGDNYCLIGPYDPDASPAEFEEEPLEGLTGEAARKVAALGYEVHTGRWLITGRPQVILLNPKSAFDRLGFSKYLFWENHDIRIPDNDELCNQAVAFAHIVEQYFRVLTGLPEMQRPVIAHFHEWLTGVAIPELRRAQLKMAIVFTTHATMLGRYLAAHDPWFYDHAPFVDWVADSRRFAIEPQVRLERAAAHGAHAFTTVSDITAFECQTLLGRRPEVLTPNGLNIERFVALHEFQNLHRIYKDRINQFVMGHFFPSYSFDLDRTLYFFTSGRYEYRNKGFDLTLKALAHLNHRLRELGTDRTIIFFIITKRPMRGLNSEALGNRAILEEIRNTCEAIKDQVGERLFQATAAGKMPDLDSLVDDYWKLRLRRMRLGWRTSRLPGVVTHDLVDDQHDEVLDDLRTHGLVNRKEDPVKVVYHPDFVSSTNPFFGIEYDQFVRGCHLGIFPSAYEPWGYTPMECMARGIPAVTSDLSGFGTYLLKHMPDHRDNGMLVVHRRYVSYEYAVTELTDWLLGFVQLERRERIALRNKVEGFAAHFDWSNLAHAYDEAQVLALTRAGMI